MQPLRPDDAPTSARPRRDGIVRGLVIVREWFNKPFDYVWIVENPSTLAIRRVIMSVFGLGTLLYAVASVAMLSSPQGPSAGVARVWVIAVIVVQMGVAYFWFFGPIPGRRAFVVFAVFADVGLTSVLITYQDHLTGLVGCALFVTSGALCTYFVGPRWLVAHVVFSCGVIIYFAVVTYLAGQAYTSTLVALTVVQLGIVAGVPPFAHIAWTTLTLDARQSALDPLTGLYNRRGWDNAVADLWQRGSDRRRSMAVLLIDIDRFKLVNDMHGHHEGDRVIELIARRLEELVGEDGLVARTGGEEFLAAVIAERAEIEPTIDRFGRALYNHDDRVPVTASVGVAVIEAHSALWSEGVGTVLRASRVADSMMYRAKEAGGDRVVAVTM